MDPDLKCSTSCLSWDDCLLLQVQSGYRNSTEVLQFTRAYENDTDFSVWNSITSLFEKLNVLLSEREDLQLKLHEFGRGLYRKIYEKLGWDPKADDGT